MTCSPMNKKSLAAENISVKVKRYFRLLFIFVGEVLNLGGLGRDGGNRVRYSPTSASSFNVLECVTRKSAKSVRGFMV